MLGNEQTRAAPLDHGADGAGGPLSPAPFPPVTPPRPALALTGPADHSAPPSGQSHCLLLSARRRVFNPRESTGWSIPGPPATGRPAKILFYATGGFVVADEFHIHTVVLKRWTHIQPGLGNITDVFGRSILLGREQKQSDERDIAVGTVSSSRGHYGILLVRTFR